MKYDPIELMKLNITEESIQKQRDFVLDALTKPYSEEINIVSFYMDRFWLPFVVDMFDGYDFAVQDHFFTIKLNP